MWLAAFDLRSSIIKLTTGLFFDALGRPALFIRPEMTLKLMSARGWSRGLGMTLAFRHIVTRITKSITIGFTTGNFPVFRRMSITIRMLGLMVSPKLGVNITTTVMASFSRELLVLVLAILLVVLAPI